MTLLALGGVLAAIATAWMGTNVAGGIILAVVAFLGIGMGVGASGTSLLALLARQVQPDRRAAAGALVWMMMILGFVITAGIAGHYLDPFTPERLVTVTSTVAALALVVATASVYGVEWPPGTQAPARARSGVAAASAAEPAEISFQSALREVWADDEARQFTLFVLVSMLAYSTQDLILEPFAGTIFGMTPGESTQLAGVQNAGVLLGMLLVALCGTLFAGRSLGSLRLWTAGGCLASAAALAGLGVAGIAGPGWPLGTSVFLLGLANGAFAVAAIASMMALAGAGPSGREGVRMGLWGAAQAIAFALGGFLGTMAIDILRWLLDVPALAYTLVFTAEALLFLLASRMAMHISERGAPTRPMVPIRASTLSGGKVS